MNRVLSDCPDIMCVSVANNNVPDGQFIYIYSSMTDLTNGKRNVKNDSDHLLDDLPPLAVRNEEEVGNGR
jgi:hypothetical protein